MRIWTRKSASIQPRTSLRKSDVSCRSRGADGCEVVARLVLWLLTRLQSEGGRIPNSPMMHLGEFQQNFVKILSNFSKFFINFCIQYSIFQNLQNSGEKNSVKFCKTFCKILRISENFAKFCKIRQKVSKFLQVFALFFFRNLQNLLARR